MCVSVCVCPAGVVLPVCPVHSEDYSSLEMPSVCVRKWLNNGARKGPPLHIKTQDIRLLNLGGLFHYFPVYVKKWQENNKLPSKWTLLIHIFFFFLLKPVCLTSVTRTHTLYAKWATWPCWQRAFGCFVIYSNTPILCGTKQSGMCSHSGSN